MSPSYMACGHEQYREGVGSLGQVMWIANLVLNPVTEN